MSPPREAVAALALSSWILDSAASIRKHPHDSPTTKYNFIIENNLVLAYEVVSSKVRVHKVRSDSGLSANLRDDEREPVVTKPPVVRLAAVRVEPPTTA